ncbi:unnamed protein product [Clavelina lepadiformis]|uniref:FH2 domain-containing protein n=1 Tax=Clavelina lepadiformis TaxID=159417 RepID=A0ABP0G379_CLALP
MLKKYKKLKAAVTGDKQKSSKKKQKQPVDATIPSTSVDDAIKKDKTVNGSDNLPKSRPILQGQPNNNNVDHAMQSNMQTDKKQNPVRRGNASSIPVTLTDGTIENESIEDKTDSTNIENTKDSTGTNDDSLKHTRSYLNSLKKRLTFSRPPKTNDTDTFLCELSAQFDKEMNLLDDIEIVEEEDKTEFKFGEKWSYLPKNDQSISTSSRAIQQASLDEFIQNTESNQTANNVTNPEKPPLIESRSSPNVVLQQGQEKPSGNRDSRVRRRRRRNLGNNNINNGVEGQSQTTAQEDMTSRRTSLPASALNFLSCAEQPVCYEDDKVIYDVPKPTATQRRAHVNVEKRSRRSRANRSMSTAAKRNSSEIRMHVWTENDLSSANSVDYPVKMRSSSPTDQVSFFDRAKKKNYRVSGISMNMEDVFSAAEEDLQKDDRRLSMPPVETPPLPLELEVAPSGKQDLLQDPDDVYAPLHQEVLALGLAYEEEEEEYQAPQTSSQQNKQNGELLSIPPPPPPPPVPPTIPPPPPISPPLMFKNTPPTSPRKMSVKRINWEKIEPVDLGNTVWGQLGEDHDTINDVVKYLDLEEHFALKKAKNLKLKKSETKKDAISILAHKKAYNTSILLAHLKLSHKEICNCLLFNGHESLRSRMEASHYHQLLMYAPDVEETKQLQAFNGNLEKLNEADFLAVKLINIPGYQIRLQALAFKHGFTEKEEEIRKNLEIIQRASLQLRKSRKLAKILEFVLAMGNYMNRGNIRISKATGFRVQFLAEMDSTKTSDNKLTFLHILARAVTTKFPDVVIFSEELMDVKNASRVIYNAVLEDLQELRKIWLYIRDNLNETACKNKEDRFKIAMETCLVRTNGSLKRLEQLRKATVKEFNKTAQYFGENPKKIGMQQFFKIFEEFTRKFEKSHNEIRHLAKHKSKSFVK